MVIRKLEVFCCRQQIFFHNLLLIPYKIIKKCLRITKKPFNKLQILLIEDMFFGICTLFACLKRKSMKLR